MTFLLFPGRHHVLTTFQADYLQSVTGPDGQCPEATVVWAVTSANHHTTKRNPVPYDRREAAIERLSTQTGLRSLVVAVHDVPPTDLFADATVKACEEALGEDLSPATTTVACSTASVAAMYRDLGYTVLPVEDGLDPQPARPWDVLLEIADGSDVWRKSAHPATVDVFERYRLDDHVRRCVNDPVIGDDGGLTPTRDYHTYAEAFETASDRKWEQIADFVRPGRILDIGCATGGLLERIDRDLRFHESDLLGVEVARHLMAECEHKLNQGVFSNPNVYFYQRNMLGDAIFSPNSIDTSISIALTHEIWSYTPPTSPSSRLDAVRRFVHNIAAHTTAGGVWINSDVCAPDDPDRQVALSLDDSDGRNPNSVRDLDGLPRAEVADHVGALSTRAKFDQFQHDFARNAGVIIGAETSGAAILLRLGDAMDFLTRKDYADNWLSESHEQFCGLTYADWTKIISEAGLSMAPGSHAWRNDWVITNRIAPVASLADPGGASIDWPVTHLLAIAEKPQ
ncbi:class I SAM-dependent methyltransferase [Microlunatus soli]|uniref:class I SAM-dependent methyltransferase n=1 Tax=Microlunatus soli TaxID=630515 RepID=UPI001E592BFA|nr:class I SAM-dependent methyltransferase [Microlunatus soli]